MDSLPTSRPAHTVNDLLLILLLMQRKFFVTHKISFPLNYYIWTCIHGSKPYTLRHFLFLAGVPFLISLPLLFQKFRSLTVSRHHQKQDGNFRRKRISAVGAGGEPARYDGSVN